MIAADMIRFCEGGGADMSRIKVLLAFAENFDPAQNAVTASYDQLSREADVSYSVVASVMQELQEKGLIRQSRKGVWKLRDRIFFPVDEVVPGCEDEEPILFRVKRRD